ncbi:casein kinase i [Ophiostoma piceae UAMH 11346]|uniref:non-specific serine/threonine protein kinase n=1 Tax=Ophiostoma piceae (strain UAMH 11346) TaxID=1262450 RepID=S3CES8_OPHP1|nr:casein kinase i [Ophiostoma piceae UAMH 11346]
MAAANWDLSPGAGSQQATEKDMTLYAGSLKALEELADTLPGFMTRLKSKADLDARQRVLAQSGGSIEQTGSGGEQVQLRVSERVGEGTFCVVYKAELLPKSPGETQTRQVAAKFELRKTDSTQLRNEFRMYKKFQTCPGVANIYSFGEMDFHKVLVMDLLGPSLESYFQDCGRHFSVKTVCMLAIQMIARVQAIHEHDLIYRDIKPENFLMGLPSTPNADMVHLIDYGMAKVFRDSETNKHIPYGEAQSLSGTARYMSINAHRRCTQSRRDDLEALGHVFLYFLRGNLPWQGVKAPQNEQRYDQMCEKKQATSIEDLCKGFPPEFAEYLTYTRSLTFDGDPDYDYLCSLFTKTLDAQGAVNDNVYDWSKATPKEDATPVLKPSPISPVTAITPPKSEPRLPPAADQPINVPEPAIKPDGLAEAARPVTPQHAANRPQTGIIPPASPPGAKRGRSEFVSELRPPTRSRPKKSIRTFYDSEAQRTLVTLYRDVMAKRYAFHRAVKQSRTGVGSATIAAAAATAALIARTNTVPGSYTRARAPMRAMGPAVISQSFSDSLDKTLAKVINELEEMSDKLLQDGDWSGAPRVQAWLEEADTATRKETQRLRLEMEEEKKKIEQRKEEDLAAHPGEDARILQQGQLPSSSTTAQPTAYLYPSSLRQASERYGQRPGGRVLIDVDQVIPLEVDDQPSTRGTQIDMTSLDTLEVDENPEEEDYGLTEMNLRARYGGRRGTGYAMEGFAQHRQTVAADYLAAAPAPAAPVVSAIAAAASGGSALDAVGRSTTHSPNISVDVQIPVSTVPDIEPTVASAPAPLVLAVPASASVSAPFPTVGSSPAVTHPADADAFPIPDIQRASPSAAVRTGINELSIAADPIDVDGRLDADIGDSDDDEPMELVYRTASGTRKVMRVPHHS